MANDETRDRNAEPRELNRRQFVQTVGAAGIVGAVGGLAPGLVSPLAAQPAAPATADADGNGQITTNELAVWYVMKR